MLKCDVAANGGWVRGRCIHSHSKPSLMMAPVQQRYMFAYWIPVCQMWSTSLSGYICCERKGRVEKEFSQYCWCETSKCSSFKHIVLLKITKMVIDTLHNKMGFPSTSFKWCKRHWEPIRWETPGRWAFGLRPSQWQQDSRKSLILAKK